MHLLWFLVIGVLAGWLAGQFMRGGGYGVIGDLVLGVVGAFIGGWLFGALGIHAGGLIGSLITATAGAVILLFLVRLIKRA
ncbi:MAG TPA: GlsB/YeaQ/YmgE family stress response membrane protein [Bryobacteraceae bacterium]|nr:GlsB/YeaQ/YmgE family stress response membrane protein [Bryobacteraceae bacterium]